MHLVFLNVTVNMYKHWSGGFGQDHPWVIPKKTWEQIGKDMVSFRKSIPSDFGRPMRDISKHSNGFKSEEWSKWTTLYSVPILSISKYQFPEKYLKPWAKFVEAVQLCSNQRDLTFDHIRIIADGFSNFVKHYEKDYYQHKEENLHFCLSVFHNLLHFTDHIVECGPPSCFWQYPMERFVGGLASNVRSRRYPYQSLSNNIVLRTRRYLTDYIRKADTWENATQRKKELKNQRFRANLLPKGKKPPKIYAIMDETAGGIRSEANAAEFTTHPDWPCVFHGPSHWKTFQRTGVQWTRLLSHYYTYYDCETALARREIADVRKAISLGLN